MDNDFWIKAQALSLDRILSVISPVSTLTFINKMNFLKQIFQSKSYQLSVISKLSVRVSLKIIPSELKLQQRG